MYEEEKMELEGLLDFESMAEDIKKEFKIALLKKKEKMLEAKLEFIREMNKLIQKSVAKKEEASEPVKEEEGEVKIQEAPKEEEKIPSDAKEAKESNDNGNDNRKEKEAKTEDEEAKEAKKNGK